MTKLMNASNSYPDDETWDLSWAITQCIHCWYTLCVADVASRAVASQEISQRQLWSICHFFGKKDATAMQKFIVPWSIAIHGLSFAKSMKIEQVKEMLIAVIDELQLMPGYPDTAAVAKRHSIAFGDLAKQAKNAAGMNHVVLCTYSGCRFYSV